MHPEGRGGLTTLEVVHTVAWMKHLSRQARAEGRRVGFVPTMGALHEGHLSLVRAAQRECAPVVVSIFVNPLQFGPGEDYDRYPRTFEQDRMLLEQAGVEILFAPTVEELYPPGFATTVTVGGHTERLEGRSRPGHFRGVATVVTKLLLIVQPEVAYFGRKDAQQARLVQQLVRDLHLDTEIVVCPIVREPDGLACSSRNRYLQGEERRAATVLYRALDAVRERFEAGERNAGRLREQLLAVLASEPRARLDYAEIVDAESFEPVPVVTGPALVLLAVWIGSTRLIDNLEIARRDGRLVAVL